MRWDIMYGADGSDVIGPFPVPESRPRREPQPSEQQNPNPRRVYSEHPSRTERLVFGAYCSLVCVGALVLAGLEGMSNLNKRWEKIVGRYFTMQDMRKKQKPPLYGPRWTWARSQKETARRKFMGFSGLWGGQEARDVGRGDR